MSDEVDPRETLRSLVDVVRSLPEVSDDSAPHAVPPGRAAA